jgi:two-component system, LytTR family, response regulator
MRKLRTIIVDDEQAGIDTIATFIEDLDKIELVKTFTEPKKALDALNGIDLIFLDMEMPKMSGIDFIRCMNSKAKVIVVTAHPKYAIQGFDYDVVDFVVKPTEEFRVIKAVNKAYQMIYPTTGVVINQVVEKPVEMIKVKVDRMYRLLKLSEIVYIESDGNYIEIFTKTNRHIVLTTLNDFCELLPANQFVRTHRSYAVNLVHVNQADANDVHVDMGKNVKLIPLSETYRKEFFNKVEGK